MLKHSERWFPGYLRACRERPPRPVGTCHVIFTLADHFEPLGAGGGASLAAAEARVERWQRLLPPLVGDFRDADGRPPCHSFFYPAEEYAPSLLDGLAGLCRAGLGEVEIHLHHDGDTAATLAPKLAGFRDCLHGRHGYLGRDRTGAPRYAFIHGNWALCNSRPDGRWCGVNEELDVLRATGCYCDMTMPSGASPTQSRTVNALYYAATCPGRSRSHDAGTPVRAASALAAAPLPEAGLLLIQGPLALNWRRRKWGLLPHFEHAELSGSNPPWPERVDLWVQQRIQVAGRPDWLFVKVHTHGGNERNWPVLLGEPLRAMHRHLQARYNDGSRFRLHYASAREMYNLVKAAEAGASGDPHPWRDFVIGPPPAARS